MGDPPASESRVPAFHFNDGGKQRRSGPFRTWFSSALRREQQSVLALHEGSMQPHDRGRPEHDDRAQQAGRAYEFRADACNHSVDGSKSRSALARAIENRELVPEQERLGDKGTSPATSKESGDRGDEMDEKDGQVAPLAIVPIRTSVTRLGTRWDLCDKFGIRHRHARARVTAAVHQGRAGPRLQLGRGRGSPRARGRQTLPRGRRSRC